MRRIVLTAICALMPAAQSMMGSADAMPIRPAPASATDPALIETIAHRRGFYVVGGVYYYNGYQGVVVARPGYRYYRGYWFPAAAFAAGAAIGGAIARPVPPPPAALTAHVRWCYAHHLSYRAYDNTYQPHYGPRQMCWSPYN
ncbi:BA14K family protein [Chelatococcus asaccharovorans]|uniref:BA14K family protein n=1 Tax=Chelatococcus asaccharovorans TaxID=28210 RepID=UPI00224C7ACE|nr:BA14K family protein [Chelatococcus asaccharovorans]CAH1651888.1 Lectin-like protein BA14k [Chelatococcus asaccharovorans]CAH1686495.1 Lectin-like protein BA14k [Chelatococcus asaccharovorans]